MDGVTIDAKIKMVATSVSATKAFPQTVMERPVQVNLISNDFIPMLPFM